MLKRSNQENHSFVSRLSNVILTMKRHSVLSLCLTVALLGVILAAPNELQSMPMIVRQEIDRAMRKAMRQIDGDSTRPTDLYSSCSSNPEEEMTTIEMIKKTGYPAEEHFITTADGYILALHRIPGRVKGSPVVLLHHALLESSFCWVASGNGRGLAHILADEGYDVWMGNVRGNTYSRNHTTLSPSNPEFWNFSWHEMGMYDVPAEIEYITSLTNRNLIYIGHSMGTTMFYVMASERPEVASKVTAMFGLAPVAFTENIRGPFYLLGSFLLNAQKMTNIEGKSEFFAQNAAFKFAAKCICNRPILRNLCRSVIFATVGFNVDQFNTSMLPLILTHTPAGTSLKTVLHYAQGIYSKKFLHYDYGPVTNKKIYNSKSPPEYDFSKIQVPITLFWAENDFLAQPKDVSRLYDNLPKKVDLLKIEDPKFNHLDFLWGNNVRELVYSKLLHHMSKYFHSTEMSA